MSDTDTNSAGHYVLVGGSFTPLADVGKALDDLPVPELLLIAVAAPIPADGSADPADADVLAIRTYLSTPWGMVRTYMAGDLVLGGGDDDFSFGEPAGNE